MAEVEHDALVGAARRGRGCLDVPPEALPAMAYRFGMKMCRDPGTWLRETFAASRTLGGFRGASSVSTWLYTIARSFCIKKRRRSVFAPEIVSLESAAPLAEAARDRAPDPERRLAEKELAAALESAIASLEPQQREILLLRDVEGLSAAEVAEVTGTSVAAVRAAALGARHATSSPAAGSGCVPPASVGVCPGADLLFATSRAIGPEAAARCNATWPRARAARRRVSPSRRPFASVAPPPPLKSLRPSRSRSGKEFAPFSPRSGRRPPRTLPTPTGSHLAREGPVSWMELLAVLVVWWALQALVLPRLGVPT
jgi:RNA polymerase sigma-70 factor (ECF subfamily)